MPQQIAGWLDRVLYPGFTDNWDDELFRGIVLERLSADSIVLDLGAGAGIVRQMNFRGIAGRVCGVDPDQRVCDNPYLDEARVGGGEAIPWPDASFDLVIADNVLEHLEHPPAVFREVFRVLKPGGVFLAKTPNRLHYVPVIARLTPHRFHGWINRLRGRAADDTFPTRYRANSPRQIERLAHDAGFELVVIRLSEGRPEYLRNFWPLYPLGWVYERLVNSTSLLSRFRVVLIAEMQKRDQGGRMKDEGC